MMLSNKKTTMSMNEIGVEEKMSLGETIARLLDIFWQVDQDLIAKGEEPIGKRPEGYYPRGNI